jgi:ABC-2 type transport system ATP-binding protein
MIPVEIVNLEKRYGKTFGAEDVTFNLKSGEILGFIGPNAAGKTTTIRALLGLIKPTGGYATLMGENAWKNGKYARMEIGFVPGEISLPQNSTARQVLELVANIKGCGFGRVSDLASRLELNLNKKIKELSLGNKKKVQIVAALINSPKLIILDEPTIGLDIIMQKVFFEILREEKERGTTILISSHNLIDIQRICDRVAIIKNGKVIAVEEMVNLKNKMLKSVAFECEHQLSEIHLSGVANLTVEGNYYKFTYNGEVKTLIDYLSQYPITNLTVTDVDLENIFLHFYE